MRLWPDLAAKAAFVVLLLGVALSILGLFDLAPTRATGIYFVVLGGLVLGLTSWSRHYWQRVIPVFDEEFPRAGGAVVRRDGSFEWEPVGTPRIGVRHGLVHRWWDAERGAKFSARLAFDIPDDVSPKTLEKATRRALGAASAALPGRGKVRATGATRDDPGPTSRVSVTLFVQGIGATPEWAEHASRAFAKVLLSRLAASGHPAAKPID